ncbi:MAG: response regulator transcription factor [Verrucomicrobia bacterium]|nr:response regulator transcription factor [Verrucomicrobiota bacterium]
MKPKRSPVKGAGSKAPKKVFIVEDHPVFREGLAQIINSESDLTVCGEAEDAEHALEAIPGLKPDLVLVDITLPGKGGLELIKELRDLNSSVKLLVLSMHDEALYADRVLRAGGDGYIMKEEDPEEVVHAIRDVLRGHTNGRGARSAGTAG